MAHSIPLLKIYVSVLLTSSTVLAEIPQVSCDRNLTGYIPEGGSLKCECKGNSSTRAGSSQQARIFWPNYSNTSVFQLEHVGRNLNGENCTCLMETDRGERATNTFRLHVAYGPTNENTTVVGPAVHVTNGSQDLTLTCEATNMSPGVFYAWIGVEACKDYTKTCTFKPQPVENGNDVFCTATNTDLPKAGTAKYTLHLAYPPDKPPVIEANTTLEVLSLGDKLTCTVRGGNPRVKSVNLTCTNPVLADQEDVFDGTSVSSSVTINTTEATEGRVSCQCSADWNTKPEFYTVRVEKTFAINLKVTSDDNDNTGSKTKVIVLGVLSGLLLMIVSVFALYVLIHRGRATPQDENERRSNSSKW